MFDFLNKFVLKKEHLNEKLEFLLPEFLVKKAITVVYANGGNGKSYLGVAISKLLCRDDGVKGVLYIDLDNPLNVLYERGFGSLLLEEKKFTCIHRSKLKASALEFLELLESKSFAGSLEGSVLVLDSLRNFVDIDNDMRVMALMNTLMNLRDYGATILALHHSTKDGRAFKGSNHIRNSADCMFYLQKTATLEQGFEVLLSVQKERAGVKDQAFYINTKDLSLKSTDLENAKISEKESAFIERVLELLENKALSTSEILAALEVSRGDNFSRNTLDKYKGVFWECTLGGENGRTFVWTRIEKIDGALRSNGSGCLQQSGFGLTSFDQSDSIDNNDSEPSLFEGIS